MNNIKQLGMVGRAVDIHRTRVMAQVANEPAAVDFNSMGVSAVDWATWLPFAATAMDISRNVDDYVLVPSIIMLNDLPNRNTVAFPLKELLKWHRDAGMPAYRLWKGQPVFVEHANDSDDKSKIKTASGVIVDVALHRLEGYGTVEKPLYKIILLIAVDRTKNPQLASDILNKKISMVSMGAYVEGYICSKCGALLGKCSHLNAKRDYDFYIDSDNELVYRMCFGITPFETSFVSVGAFPMSVFQKAVDVRTGEVVNT